MLRGPHVEIPDKLVASAHNACPFAQRLCKPHGLYTAVVSRRLASRHCTPLLAIGVNMSMNRYMFMGMLYTIWQYYLSTHAILATFGLLLIIQRAIVTSQQP